MQSNNKKIYQAVKKLLEDGKYVPYVHNADGNSILVDDIDVITCFYGNDKARLESTKQALQLFSKYKARPHQMIVVEAQFNEDQPLLEDICNASSMNYIFVKLSEEQRGIYVRQALLNIAISRSQAQKLVCIDSDVGFCNPYWLKNVSLLLDECEVAQPFGYAYFAYQDKYEPIRTNIEKSALRLIAERNDKRMLFNTGLAWAMTRRAFDKIKGFDVLTCPSEDIWFWHKFLEISQYRICALPYQTFLDDCNNKLLIADQVKTNDEICFHIEHGTPNSRRYAAYVYACNRQAPSPLCDIEYDKSTPMILPKWKNDIWTKLRKQTIKLISEDANELYATIEDSKKSARRALNQANMNVFGKIPKNKTLRVVTILDDLHTKDDVIQHKDLFEKHLKNTFQYICIANEEIPGIKTIKPSGKVKHDFQAIEVFRKDISRTGITLYVSLDVVPVNDIMLCNVPKAFIGMNNPRHSKHIKSLWKMYLCNAMLFSGDFSFVYDSYVDESGKFSQQQTFMQLDQCIAYNMYVHGIDIRSITQFIDTCTVKLDGYSQYSEYLDKIVEVVANDQNLCTDLATGNMAI